MGNLKLKGKDILKLGYPNNQSINVALEVMKRHAAGKNIQYVKSVLKAILAHPQDYVGDLAFGQIAEALLCSTKTEKRELSAQRAPFQIFGTAIAEETKTQLYTALKLPVSVAGALMPDAHSGYGLPIGGGAGYRKCCYPLWGGAGHWVPYVFEYLGYTDLLPRRGKG